MGALGAACVLEANEKPRVGFPPALSEVLKAHLGQRTKDIKKRYFYQPVYPAE